AHPGLHSTIEHYTRISHTKSLHFQLIPLVYLNLPTTTYHTHDSGLDLPLPVPPLAASATALSTPACALSAAAPHSGAADRPGGSSRACQNDRGKPRTCSARYARMRLVEIGATRYRRVSRNLRSTSYSAAKPKPPWVCRHTLAAS